MNSSTFITKASTQTKKLGGILAKEILTPHQYIGGGQKGAFILGLKGDLGGGKTTFLQGFAKGLGIKEKILSPTFVIMRKFKIPIRVHSCSYSSRFAYFYHIDCYRIAKSKEILDLGFKEIISNPQNIVAIEWVDKIKNILPRKKIMLEFEVIGQNRRKIKIAH